MKTIFSVKFQLFNAYNPSTRIVNNFFYDSPKGRSDPLVFDLVNEEASSEERSATVIQTTII